MKKYFNIDNYGQMRSLFLVPMIFFLFSFKSYSQDFDESQYEDKLNIEYYNSLMTKSKYESHIRTKDYKILEYEFRINGTPIIRYSMPKFREYHITYSTTNGNKNTIRTMDYEIETFQHWRNRFRPYDEWKLLKIKKLRSEFEEKKKKEEKIKFQKNIELKKLDSLKQRVTDLNQEVIQSINSNLLEYLIKVAIYSLNYKIFDESNSGLLSFKKEYISSIFLSDKILTRNDYYKFIDLKNRHNLGFYNLINWNTNSNLDFRLYYFDKLISKNINLKFDYNNSDSNKNNLPKIIKTKYSSRRYINSYAKLLENILSGNNGNFSFSYNNCLTLSIHKANLGLDNLFKTFYTEFEKLDDAEFDWENSYDHTNIKTIRYLEQKIKKLEIIREINLKDEMFMTHIVIPNSYNDNNCIINFAEFYDSNKSISMANVVFQEFYIQLLNTFSEKLNTNIGEEDKKIIINLIINSADFKDICKQFENKIVKNSSPYYLFDTQKENWSRNNIETSFVEKGNKVEFSVSYNSPIRETYYYSFNFKKHLLYQIKLGEKVRLE